jgi:hypothetical protein
MRDSCSLDFPWLHGGRSQYQSQNNIGNINALRFHHQIRGNLGIAGFNALANLAVHLLVFVVQTETVNVDVLTVFQIVRALSQPVEK